MTTSQNTNEMCCRAQTNHYYHGIVRLSFAFMRAHNVFSILIAIIYSLCIYIYTYIYIYIYILKQSHKMLHYINIHNYKLQRRTQRSFSLKDISRASPWSCGSVLDYRSLPPVFEFRGGHI